MRIVDLLPDAVRFAPLAPALPLPPEPPPPSHPGLGSVGAFWRRRQAVPRIGGIHPEDLPREETDTEARLKAEIADDNANPRRRLAAAIAQHKAALDAKQHLIARESVVLGEVHDARQAVATAEAAHLAAKLADADALALALRSGQPVPERAAPAAADVLAKAVVRLDDARVIAAELERLRRAAHPVQAVDMGVLHAVHAVAAPHADRLADRLGQVLREAAELQMRLARVGRRVSLDRFPEPRENADAMEQQVVEALMLDAQAKLPAKI